MDSAGSQASERGPKRQLARQYWNRRTPEDPVLPERQSRLRPPQPKVARPLAPHSLSIMPLPAQVGIHPTYFLAHCLTAFHSCHTCYCTLLLCNFIALVGTTPHMLWTYASLSMSSTVQIRVL